MREVVATPDVANQSESSAQYSGWEVVSSIIPQTKESVQAQMQAEAAIESENSDQAWKALDIFARTQSSRICSLDEYRYTTAKADSPEDFVELLRKDGALELDARGAIEEIRIEGQLVPLTVTMPIDAERFVQFSRFPHLIVAEDHQTNQFFDASLITSLNQDTVRFVEQWSADRQEALLRAFPDRKRVVLDLSNLPTLDEVETKVTEHEQPNKGVEVSVSEYEPTDLDVLEPGETLWGEVAEELGAGQDDEAVVEVVSEYLSTPIGKQTVWELASQTHEGTACIARFGLKSSHDLSTEQAHELARYLAPGELSGLVDFIESLSSDPEPKSTDPEVLLDALEGARDTVVLEQGMKPLEAVEMHISRLFAAYSYDSNLAKQALDHYILNTTEGKQWLFAAIIENTTQSQHLVRAHQKFTQHAIENPKDLAGLLVDSKGRPSSQVFWMELSRAIGASRMVHLNQSIVASIKANL